MPPQGAQCDQAEKKVAPTISADRVKHTTQPDGQGPLENIPGQGYPPRKVARRAADIGGADITTAFGANIGMPETFGDEEPKRNRAQRIRARQEANGQQPSK